MMIPLTRLKFVWLLPLIGATAIAQTQDDADDQTSTIFELSPFQVNATEGYQATNVISATRVDVPLSDLPLTINVITQDFIRDIGADNLMEAVRYAPGVIPGATSATGGAGGGASNSFTETFIIRGQDVRFNYRDGVRQWRGAEPAFTERIEVIKGPTAILYGQALPGGALNSVSKRPMYESYGMVGLSLDSFGTVKGEIDATGPLGENRFAAYRVGLLHREGDTFVDYEYLDYTAMSGTLEVNPWKGGTIRLNTEILDRRVDNMRSNGTVAWSGPLNEGKVHPASGTPGQYIGIHPLADETTNPFGVPVLDAYMESKTRNWTLTLEQNLMEGLDLRVNGAYVDTGFETFNSSNNAVVAFDLPVVDTDFNPVSGAPGDMVSIGGRDYVVGLGADLAGNAISNATPGVHQGGVRKVAVYRGTNDLGPLRFIGNSLAAPNLFNPNQAGPTGFWPVSYNNKDRTLQIDLTYAFETGPVNNRILVGYENLDSEFGGPQTVMNPQWEGDVKGFAYDLERKMAVDIFGNPWTEAGTSIRLFNTKSFLHESGSEALYATYMGSMFEDRLHMLLGIRDSDLKQRTRTTNPYNEFSDTSAQFGVLYQVTEQFGVYGSHSESFLLSNIRFRDKAPSPSNPDAYVPNDLFPPQEGEGLDIGVKFNLLNGRLSGNLTYYNIERTEVPILDPDVIDIDGNAVFFPGGVEEVDGLELEMFWQMTEQFQLIGGFTYSDSRFVKVGRGQEWALGLPRTGTNEWNASLYGKYVFTEGRFEGFTVNGGAYYASAEELGRAFDHGDYIVADGSVSYTRQWKDALITYTLNVRNIFDEKVYKGFTGADPGRGFYLSARVEF